MSLLNIVLTALFPVFLCLGAGMAMRLAGWLTATADQSLVRITVRVFYPALILSLVVGNPALQNAANLIIPPIVGFSIVALGFVIAWYLGPLAGLTKPTERRTLSFTTGIYNYGYIAIPLVVSLFGQEGAAGVLIVLNLGVEIAFWTLGVLILSGGSNLKGVVSKLLNPPALAIIAGIIINLTGLDTLIPAAIDQTFTMLGACAIPFGLILSGATLADTLPQLRQTGIFRISLVACLVRFGLVSLLVLLAARWLPFSEEMRQVLCVVAAMPAGMFPIVVARHYQGSATVAAQIVVSTTLLSLFIIPVWISWGIKWLGLE